MTSKNAHQVCPGDSTWKTRNAIKIGGAGRRGRRRCGVMAAANVLERENRRGRRRCVLMAAANVLERERNRNRKC